MSSKVWLVSEGSYSDYCIVGAFSTEAGAEEFRAMFCGSDSGIEEYDVDEYVKHVKAGVRAFYVNMAEDGSNAHASIRGFPVDVSNFADLRDRPYTSHRPDYAFAGAVNARDKEHAIEIANDRRVALLALPREP